MNRSARHSLAAAALLLPSLLAAQAPAPFSAMPGDAEVFARIDFQAMSQAPGLGEMIQWYKGTDANFQNSLFQGDDRLKMVMNQQAGETMIYELGATFNPEKMDESEFYLVTYGSYNPAAIFQAATAQGLVKGPDVAGKSTLTDPEGTYILTMANDWTLALASSPFALGNILATGEDPARTLRSDSSLAGLMGAAAGSFIAVGSRMEGGVRKGASDLAANPPAELMMLPGALPVVKGLETIRSAGYAFTPTAHVAQVEYTTPEAATAGATNLTMMIKGLAALGAMQAGNDPAAQAQLQAMQNVNLVAQGTSVGYTQPVTPEGLRTMAQQMQMAMPMIIQQINAAKAQAEQQGAAATTPGALPAASTPAGTIIPASQRQEFPNFQAADIKNEFVDLEQYEGKVVMVDYWATWCGPCRQTKPFIKDMYARRHNDGLEIIGVSLDEDINALRTYVSREKMPWRQVTDLKGWSSKYAQQMGVNSIPHVFVLDKQGKIAARGSLRGEELETIVAQVMAE